MCVDGYLEAENYGRWTTYKIKPKLASLDTNLATSGRKVDTSGGKVASFDRKVDTSSSKVASLRDRNLATSGRKVATSKKNVLIIKEMAERRLQPLKERLQPYKIARLQP